MFLQILSEYLFSNYKEIMQDVCVVVPNMRAKLHLRNHLHKAVNTACFMPEMLSTEEFITEIVEPVKHIEIIDNISQLLLLYETHCKLSEDKDFHNFTLWAYSVLKDFNELDLYLSDIKDVYNYISEEQAIKLWNPEKGELTDFEKNYIHFLNSLYDYYLDFHQSLSDCNRAYSGMAYRFVAENIEEIASTIRWKKIVFAGFNALSKSESLIFNYLYNNHFADIVWDADKYYIDNSIQEAGHFLRQNFKLWPETSKTWTFDEISKEKTIHIISSPGNIQQASIAGNILSDNDFVPSETAIILADETLLLPTLNCIPEKYEKFNVTMDAPVSINPICSLISSLIAMHARAIFNNESEAVYQIEYYKAIVTNPCFTTIMTDNSDTLKLLKSLIIYERIFVNQLEEIDSLPIFVKAILCPWNNNTSTALLAIKQTMNTLLSFYNNDKYIVEYEIVVSLTKAIDSVSSQIALFPFLEDFKVFSVLSKSLINDAVISFKGEPLEGLQIQGILETRLLDFKNIIILSVNEDVIPKKEAFSTYLTYGIYEAYKIPSIYEKNAVFAYHFYRLLERAKNVFLLYNSADTDKRFSEPSRFISQITNELQSYSANIVISEDSYGDDSAPVDSTFDSDIVKNSLVIELIYNYLTNNILSVSAINTYLNCPLQFYYKYILKISDQVETNSIDSATLGNIVHNSLKMLYINHLNELLTIETMSKICENIENVIDSSFQNEGLTHDSGNNLLLYQFIKQYINKQIYSDYSKVANKHSLSIISLETKYTTTLDLSDLLCKRNTTNASIDTNNHSGDKDILSTLDSIKVKGIVDRIEILDGEVRIMDYKTGSITQLREENQIEFDTIFANPTYGDNPKLIQLLYYAMLVMDNCDYNNIKSGLYAMRYSEGVSEKVSEKVIKQSIDKAFIKDFIHYLKKIISEIMDKSIPFTKCNDKSHCVNCRYCVKA